MSKNRATKQNLNDFAEVIPNIKALGPVLQKRRKEAGYTQESFAEAVDINVNTIKYIEQGRRAPSLSLLLRITKLLKIQIKLESH